MTEKQTVRIWGNKGVDGNPPLWHVLYHNSAHKEARKVLDDAQYLHVKHQIKELACSKEPVKCLTCDVRSIDSYFELRDKGAVLGKINLRVYFCTMEDNIFILGVYKKENEGSLRVSLVRKYRRRMRQCSVWLLAKKEGAK